jgi:hypothetical protein
MKRLLKLFHNSLNEKAHALTYKLRQNKKIFNSHIIR